MPQPDAQLLALRAKRLRQRPKDEEDDSGVWAAEFSLGQERFALPLERLLACLPLRGVTPVPKARPEIVGIARWEGKVVAVFSLANLLGQKAWYRDPSVLLMLRHGNSAIGLDCEETPRSVLLPPQFQAPKQDTALSTLSLPASGLLPARQVQWIDPDRLLEFAGQR